MEDARTAWVDVASKVESLGLKLKLHLEQETDEAVAERETGEVANAFDQLSGQVKDAFDAFGNATRDESVQSDMREIGDLLKEALVETFHAVGAEVGDLMGHIEDYTDGAAEKLADVVGGGETKGSADAGASVDDELIPPSDVQDSEVPDGAVQDGEVPDSEDSADSP